jgi:hypothetical protein
VCIAITFVLRMVTVKFDIHTHAVYEHALRTRVHTGLKSTVSRLHRKRRPSTDVAGEARSEPDAPEGPDAPGP